MVVASMCSVGKCPQTDSKSLIIYDSTSSLASQANEPKNWKNLTPVSPSILDKPNVTVDDNMMYTGPGRTTEITCHFDANPQVKCQMNITVVMLQY